jgi:hypothetical protein
MDELFKLTRTATNPCSALHTHTHTHTHSTEKLNKTIQNKGFIVSKVVTLEIL